MEENERLRLENSALRMRIASLEAHVERLNRRTEPKLAQNAAPWHQQPGSFYIIELAPDRAPGRVKMGWARIAEARLSEHRIAAPSARLIAAFECLRSNEHRAIDALSRVGCRTVARSHEVFDVDDVDELVRQAEVFFGVLPTHGQTADLFRDNAAGQVGL